MGRYQGALEMIRRANAKQLRAKGLEPTQLWFHGTNRDIAPSADRPLWLGSPELALLFTGGGRNAGITSRGGLGRMYPYLLREKPQDTGLDVLEGVHTMDDSWLAKLGIDKPRAFRDALKDRTEALAQRQLQERWPDPADIPEHIGMGWDDMGATWFGSKDFGRTVGYRPRSNQWLYTILDNKPFRDQLLEDLGSNSLSLKFEHPRRVARITPGGLRKVSDQMVADDAVLVPNPEAGLINFFEAMRME